MAKKATRASWLDAKKQTPVIEEAARQMESFVTAMADGIIEAHELKQQEERLVALMKEIEPLLDDDMHEKITKLLCELTVYDLMQILHTMQQSKPTTKFRG